MRFVRPALRNIKDLNNWPESSTESPRNAIWGRSTNGSRSWVLRADTTPTPRSGRYLIVVDSMADARPDGSPSSVGRSAAVVRPPS